MFEITTGFYPSEKYWTIEDAEHEALNMALDFQITVHILRNYRGFTKKTYLGYVSPEEV